MWSVGLIVSVAAIASLVLMAAGITTAITFERRRHRKYIEQHFGGMVAALNTNASRLTDDRRTPTKCSSSRFSSDMRRSSVAWVPLSSTKTTNQTQSTTSRSSGSGPPLATKKVLRKTLNGPIKKSIGKRRQLRRTVRLVNIPNSPLSVITEKSDNSHSSPPAGASPVVVNPQHTPETYDNGTVIRSELPVSKMRKLAAYNSLARTNSTGCSMAPPRPIHVPRSISMSSSISSAPGDPLPPIPAVGARQTVKSGLTHHTSNVSIDSVGSSVLGASSIISSPPRAPIGKPSSQALQDFDFGLDTVAKLRSSPHLLHRSPSESSAATVVFLKANANPRSDLCRTASTPRVRFKENPVSAREQAGFIGTNSTDQCPMPKDSKISDGRLVAMICSTRSDENNDPFFTGTSTRPGSMEDRIPLEELVNQTCNKRSSVGSRESVKGHKRQHCVKISTLPLVPSTPSHFRQLHETEPKKKLQASASTKVKRTTAGTSVEAQHDLSALDEDLQPSQICLDASYSRTNACDTTASTSATPISKNAICWNFDFILPNTPKLHISPSPLRTHDSPILPSPAYTSANLYPQQRPSLVRGPRNPRTSRSRSQSPLKNKPKLVDLDSCINADGAHSYGTRRRIGSTDLRKSVQLLRSMNSEARLLSAEQEYMYRRLSSTNNSLRLAEDTKESGNLLTVPEIGNSSQTSLAIVPLPSPLAVPKTGINKPSPLLSHSSESASRTSIWEDVSVRDDSPEPELPLSVLVDENGKPLLRGSTIRIVARDSSAGTKVCKGQENSIHAEERQLPAWQATMGERDGPQYLDEGLSVADTPRSIYDENGFLKE